MCEHVCERACKRVFWCVHAVSLLACALFVFVNGSQMLCVSKSCQLCFYVEFKKKRETETLPKVLKLVSSYRGTMAIAGDRPSLLSGLFSPPLCFALTKGLWV